MPLGEGAGNAFKRHAEVTGARIGVRLFCLCLGGTDKKNAIEDEKNAGPPRTLDNSSRTSAEVYLPHETHVIAAYRIFHALPSLTSRKNWPLPQRPPHRLPMYRSACVFAGLNPTRERVMNPGDFGYKR
jgi:hypothetical protein